MLFNEIVASICKMFGYDDINVEVVFEDALNSPYFDSETNIVHLVKRDGILLWNLVYQFSHEYLHYMFQIHSKGQNKDDSRWIEEIVCEAFSIYCLTLYCIEEGRYWHGYLYHNFYILNRNIESCKPIKGLGNLNFALSGYKEMNTRQFIHPVVLRILKIIEMNYKQLLDMLDLTKFVSGNEITGIHDNEIISILSDFQYQIML